ncbi:DUF1444 family protein [Sulfurovum sp. zt1-1]|uniref:DUF1444 family protein n=1 Tax=Sulfurovum zhangzhouensis TaxID=3019067 RepID=A0ABT7QX42_9BACT|nr:DUF1444 family protein [Sulfurovum zhangzhouensis]MDM5270906.1 DUF1444 family protein [Sulfurovum zhangzhouensis]
MKKIIFIGILSLTTFLSAEVLSDKAFTKYFIKTLKYLDSNVSIQEKGWFHLELSYAKDEGKVTAYLDNAYKAYQEDKGNLEEIVKRYAKNALDGLHSYDYDREVNIDNIVPIIKDTTYLDQLKEIREGNLTDAYEVYNKDLVIFYAEDTPERLSFLQATDISSLSISHKDLRALAVKNLNRILAQKIEIEPYEESFILHADGNFETSLILADELWKSRQIEVNGDYIVIVPARGLILVTGSKNKKGIDVLRAVAKGAETEASYPVSSQLFRFNGEKFVRFE